LKKIIKLEPTVSYYEKLAECYIQLDKYKKAIESYSNALLLSDDIKENISLNMDIAKYYADKCKYNKAIKYYLKAMELEETNEDIHRALVNIYYNKEDFTNQIYHAIKTIKYSEEKYALDYSYLADGYKNIDQLDDALYNAKEAVKLNNKSAEFAYDLSQIYFTLENYDEAYSYLKIANELNEDEDNDEDLDINFLKESLEVCTLNCDFYEVINILKSMQEDEWVYKQLLKVYKHLNDEENIQKYISKIEETKRLKIQSYKNYKALDFISQWEDEVYEEDLLYNIELIHEFVLDDGDNNFLDYWFEEKISQKDKDSIEVFAQTGEGGYFAYWNYEQLLGDAPIVFFSSDGEYNMIASSIDDLVCLFATNRQLYAEDTQGDVWQDTDWSYQIEDILNDEEYNFDSIEEIKEKFFKDIHRYTEFISYKYEIKDAKKYIKNMKKHPSFRKWVENIL